MVAITTILNMNIINKLYARADYFLLHTNGLMLGRVPFGYPQATY